MADRGVSADILPFQSGSSEQASTSATSPKFSEVHFQRNELDAILWLYGRMVAKGEWRDYAIDATREKAVFSIFRRTSEMPLYRIEKTPKLARKQGIYSVVGQGGLIMKRGHDLKQVLKVLDKEKKVSVI